MILENHRITNIVPKRLRFFNSILSFSKPDEGIFTVKVTAQESHTKNIYGKEISTKPHNPIIMDRVKILYKHLEKRERMV